MGWTSTVGLEVHVQLKTRSKMFCGCPTEAGAPPNSHVCPVCLGYPGAMPAMNREAVRFTVLAGLMVGSEISSHSKFDRKSYFYPDMPKNYQITQYDRPLCVGGAVDCEVNGRPKTVRLRRIHLEEDVGKSMHFVRTSGVDFNRAGVPLMEIVTEPDIETADEAFAFLLTLKQIMLYAGVSDCNLEQGNLRCDVNVSIRREGETELGTKVEIKNLNTFKGVHHAVLAEIARQIEARDTGEPIVQETRRWDTDRGVTCSMRTKEYAHDYRYFPEPDLMPVALPREQVEAWARELPELPRQRRERFVRQYGLPEYDAKVLVADKAVADYFEEAAKHARLSKSVSNWVMTEILRLLSEKEMEVRDLRISPVALGALADLAESRTVNSNTAKEIFAELVEKGGDPAEIVRARGLAQVSDAGALEGFADRAIAENARSVEDYRKGKAAALMHLVGQVMKLSRGKANPQMVAELLKRKLGG